MKVRLLSWTERLVFLNASYILSGYREGILIGYYMHISTPGWHCVIPETKLSILLFKE